MKHKRTKRRRIAAGRAIAASCMILFATAALSDTALAQEQEYQYAIFDLPVVSEPLSATRGINDAGVLVGHSFLPGFASHAAAWYRGNVFDLGLPEDAILARGNKINTKNEIAGWYIVSGGNPYTTRAIAWKNGTFHELGTLGGPYSASLDINDVGQIVGQADVTSEPRHFHAFLWDRERGMIHLDTLAEPESNSVAWGINSFGQIVGYSWGGQARRAVLWDNGKIMDLGSLWGNETDIGEASDINDLGQIVGRSETSDLVYRLPFLWEDGVMQQLPQQQNRVYSLPWTINNSSVIVGTGFVEDGRNFAVLWSPPDFEQQDLEALIPPNSGIALTKGSDINERNQIAADGFFVDDPDENTRAFFLSPVTPELKLSDPAPGIAGQVNSWTIINAQSNAQITFVYGTRGGGSYVPKCDVLDAAIQIDDPKVMGTVTADANGEATIELFVPAAARNLGDILFQAVSLKDCEESQLVVFKFE